MSQSAAHANAITTQPLISPTNNADMENKANTPVCLDEAASVITTQPMMNDPTDEEQEEKKQEKLQKLQTHQTKNHVVEAIEDTDDCIWCCFATADCCNFECPNCDNCCDGDGGDCCTGCCDGDSGYCCTGCCDGGPPADSNIDGDDCAGCIECCGSCFECCSSD